MKLSKLTLTVATILGVTLSSAAFAIELYVDTHTKQIYAEPGKGRKLMGKFVHIEEKNAHHKHQEGEHDFADIKAIQEDLALKNNAIKALEEKAEAASTSASGMPTVTMDKKGLQVISKDKNFKFKFGGRIHADASFAGEDNYFDSKGHHVRPDDGTEIRRARMRMEGVFFKDWLFRTEVDFGGDAVNAKDVYLQYLGAPHVIITAGQQKQNFSRELQESSNDMMFTERSLMNVLNTDTVDRAIGLNLESFGKNYVAKLGVFGNSLKPHGTTTTADLKTGAVTTSNKAGDEGWAISSRLAYAPINEKGKLIHLGVAGNYRVPDTNGEVAESKSFAYGYKTTEMSNFNPLKQSITGAKDIKMLGLEFASIYGPFSLGGEYTRTWIDRVGRTGAIANQNVSFDGWYADAAYTLTGESRTYKNGNMTHLKIDKPFNPSKGNWGAVEAAIRYSGVNLNDGSFASGGIQGGKMNEITGGLNWYFNSNFRLLANYTRLLNITGSPLTTVGGQKMDGMGTFMLRGQVAF